MDRVEVAVADVNGRFQVLPPDDMTVTAEQTIRVALYRETLASPNAERTVSVRLAGAAGVLVAQQRERTGSQQRD